MFIARATFIYCIFVEKKREMSNTYSKRGAVKTLASPKRVKVSNGERTATNATANKGNVTNGYGVSPNL